MISLKPRLSVIIPVYNSSKYLYECLRSVTEQNIKDIEIICVNDGSTDDSLYLLKKYAEKDERIVVVNKCNAGLPAARNTGLKLARGRFILHLDSDDFLEKGKLLKILELAESSEADILVFGGSTFPVSIDWANNVLNVKDRVVEGQREIIDALFNETGSRPFTWNKLYKAELINKFNVRYNEKIELGEDQAYQFSIFPFANKVIYTSISIYKYRQHHESMMSFYQNNPRERLLGHVSLISSVVNFWKDQGLIKNYREYLFNWALDHVFISDFEWLSCREISELTDRLIMLIDITDGFDGLSIYNKALMKKIRCANYLFKMFCKLNKKMENVVIVDSILPCLTFKLIKCIG